MEGLLWVERLLWSGPLLAVLLGSHVYFTGKLRGVQRRTFRGIRLSLQQTEEGGVSRLGALSTSLAAAIGTGNIIGVATAVALGGPGAVFWCWLTGLLGMATRYGETVLALRHRRRQADGTWSGGAMYVLSDWLGRPRLGRAFAVLGVLAAVGTGSVLQANAIGSVLWSLGRVPQWLSGACVAGLGAVAILGGARSISRACQVLVPAMAALYLAGCGAVLWTDRAAIFQAIQLILTRAVVPQAAGGGFVGSTMMTAARYGVARGLFTNEAGMGTAPMAAAAGPGEHPAREALVSMTGVFWDTVVVCGITGLTLVTAMTAHPQRFSGAEAGALCQLAFSGVPGGKEILALSLVAFAFATVIGWCWYGECCWRFLTRGGPGLYRAIYLAGAFFGVFGRLEAVWSMGSILAGLMTVPNLYALFRCRQEIAGTLPAESRGTGRSVLTS